MSMYLNLFEELLKKITLKKVKPEEIVQLHELFKKTCEIYEKNESNLSKSFLSTLSKDFFDVLCSYYENATIYTKTSIELNLVVLQNALHLAGTSLMGDIISYILDVILDPRQSFWLVYYTTKMLNNILSINKEAILSRHIIIQDMTQFKLMDFIMLCGDYECQSAMLELIFRLRKDVNDQKVVEGFFPENIDLQYALTIINVENFDVDARFFLNTLNVYGNSVTSVKAETVFIGNREIMPPMEFRMLNGNNFWIDFNSKSFGVSFNCAKDSLLTNPVTDVDEPWEYIFVPNSIVKTIDIKKKRGFYIMEFELNNSLIVQLESSKDFVNKCRNIKFAFKIGHDVDALIDSFLPTIFDCLKKKQPKKLSMNEPQKMLYKPLAIEIRNRSSLGSELPSVKSVVTKQAYLDICSKTVGSRSVVSGKQIREVFESGEEDDNTVNDIQHLQTKITDSGVLEDINQLQKNISEINTYLLKDNLKKHTNQYIKAQVKRNVKPRRRPPSTLDSISENEENYYVTKSYETFKDNLIANSSPVSSNSIKKVISSTYINKSELQRNHDKTIKDSTVLEKDLSDSYGVSNEPSVILETQSQKIYSQATNDYEYRINMRDQSINDFEEFENFFEEMIYSNDIRRNAKTVENKEMKENEIDLTTDNLPNSKIDIGEEIAALTSNGNNEIIDITNTNKKNKGEVLKAIDEQSWKKIKDQANLIPKKKVENLENDINNKTECSVLNDNAEKLIEESINNRIVYVETIKKTPEIEQKEEISQNREVKVKEKPNKRGRKSKENDPENSEIEKVQQTMESENSDEHKDIQTNLDLLELKGVETKAVEKKKRGKKSIPRVKQVSQVIVKEKSESINNTECIEENPLESTNIDVNSIDVTQLNEMNISYKHNNFANLEDSKKLQIKLRDIYGHKSITGTNSKNSSIDFVRQSMQKLEQCDIDLDKFQTDEIHKEEDNDDELNSNSKIIIKDIYILPNKDQKNSRRRKTVTTKNKILPKRSTRRKTKKSIIENPNQENNYSNKIEITKEQEIDKDNQLSVKNLNENTLNLISPDVKGRGQNDAYNKSTICNKVSKNTLAELNFDADVKATHVKRVRKRKCLSLKPKSNDKLSMETNESCVKEIVPEKLAEVDGNINNILPSDKSEKVECDKNKSEIDMEKSQSLHTINYLDGSRGNDISEGPAVSTRDIDKTFDIDSVSRQGEHLDMDNESIGNKSRLNDSINSSKISLMAKTYIDMIKKTEIINKRAETNLNKSDTIIKGNKIVTNKRTRRLYNPNDTSSLLFDNLTKDKQNMSIDTELSVQKKVLTNENKNVQNENLNDTKENKNMPTEEKSFLDEADVNTSRDQKEIIDLKKMYEERVRIAKSLNLEYEEDSEFEDEHRDIEELDYIDIPETLKEDRNLKKLYEEREKYYDSCFDTLLGKSNKEENNIKETCDNKPPQKNIINREDNVKDKSKTKRKRIIKKAVKKVVEETSIRQSEKLSEENVADVIDDEDNIDKVNNDDELNEIKRNSKRQKVNEVMQVIEEYDKGVDSLLNSEDNYQHETSKAKKSKNKKTRTAKKAYKKCKETDTEGENKENVGKRSIENNYENEERKKEENEIVKLSNDKNEDIQTENRITEDIVEYNNNEEEAINKLEEQNDQDRSIMPNIGKLTSAKRKRDPFENLFNKRAKKIKESHTVDKSKLSNNSADLENSTFFDSLFKEKKSNWFNKPEANSKLNRNNRRSLRILKKSDENEGKLQKSVALLKEIRENKDDHNIMDKDGVKNGYKQIMEHAEDLCVSREIIKTEIIRQKFFLKSIFQICRQMLNEK